MRRLVIGIVVGLAVIGPSAAAQETERKVIALTDPARRATLDISLWAGVVNIVAADAATVVVDGTRVEGTSRADERGRVSKAVPADRSDRAAGLTRLRPSTGVEIDQANNVVTIRGPVGERIDLEIRVPRRTNLKLTKSAPGSPTSPGSVTVRGVEGDLEVRTNAGSITFIDVSGSVVAHSTNGSVNATVQHVTADRPMAFTSYKGIVDVTLPRTLKANLILQSTRGDVFTDFDVQKHSRGVFSGEAPAAGGARGTADRQIVAPINGGGPDVELRSYAASIYLRRGN